MNILDRAREIKSKKVAHYSIGQFLTISFVDNVFRLELSVLLNDISELPKESIAKITREEAVKIFPVLNKYHISDFTLEERERTLSTELNEEITLTYIARFL